MRVRCTNYDAGLFRADPFHNLVETPTWRLLLLFWAMYCFAFAAFALAYWSASGTCNIGCDTYPQALLLSVETMLTIGYGVPDPYFQDCPWFVSVLIVQCITAILFDSLFAGVIYQRFSRGTARASTVMFSDKAVIRAVDGALFFMFQVCEMRRTHLLDSHIRCYLFSRPLPNEGSFAEQRSRTMASFNSSSSQGDDSDEDSSVQRWLSLGDTCRHDFMRLELPDDDLGAPTMLIIPQVIAHRIDSFSPMLGPNKAAFGLAEGNHALNAMVQQAHLAPPQRTSEALTGNRDGCWCQACGSSYPSEEQLRKHVAFTAAQEEPSEKKDDGETQVGPHVLLRRHWTAGPTVETFRRLLEDRMRTHHLEVVCVLEGCDAVTSNSVQARHSYTVDDMCWDCDFAPCTKAADGHRLAIDFVSFHNLVPCNS